jgi:secondary thiamine-phosphate synthase enzyme
MDKTIIETSKKVEVLNVTAQVSAIAQAVGDGLILLSVPHTTAALLLCEDDEELRADLVKVAENWLAQLEPFSHRRKNNPNAAAHILSAFGGTQLFVSVRGGLPELGTYQQVLLVEMDGPKPRELWSRLVA